MRQCQPNEPQLLTLRSIRTPADALRLRRRPGQEVRINSPGPNDGFRTRYACEASFGRSNFLRSDRLRFAIGPGVRPAAGGILARVDVGRLRRPVLARRTEAL